MLIILFIRFSLESFSPDHAITFEVTAPFHRVPLFNQLLFFLHDFSPHIGKSFLNKVLSQHSKIDNFNFLLENAESLISQVTYQLLVAEIENDYYLPRGEMFLRMANSLDPISDIIYYHNEDNCSLENNNENKFQLKKYSNDIKFNRDISANEEEIYVFADLSNLTVANEILSLISENKSFVLRPFSRKTSENVNLCGFGIELIPKNKINDGFMNEFYETSFDTINEPVVDGTIRQLSGIPPSYINPILYEQKFGEKFTCFLRKEGIPLPEALKDITANFPLFSPYIIASEEKSKDVLSYQRVEDLLNDNQMFTFVSVLNGRHVNLNSIDLYSLFDVINEETSFKTILEEQFKMKDSLVLDLCNLNLLLEDETVFDYRSDTVLYINNLEKDRQYENWTSDINALYNLSEFSYPNIRKNLLNFVLFANPTTKEGADALFGMVSMFQQHFPARFGFVPFFDLKNKYERKVAYAFNFLFVRNRIAALQYLVNVYQKSKFNPKTRKLLSKPSIELFEQEFNSITNSAGGPLMWDSLFALYDSDSNETKTIFKTNEYIEKCGIKKQFLLLNGHQIHETDISLIKNDNAKIRVEIQVEIIRIQQALKQMDLHSINSMKFDIMDVYCQIFSSTKNIDSRVFLYAPKGLHLYRKSLSIQQEFVDFLSKIKWDYEDDDKISNFNSFVWIFHPKTADLSVFNDFMRENHEVPTSFAFNPEIPENIFTVQNKNAVTLIYNGRIFEDVDIKDLNLLKNIEKWSNMFVSKTLSLKANYIGYRRREALMYLSCMIVDWREDEISRGFPFNDIWSINSSLVYQQKNSFSDLNWDLIINPFTKEYQRIAPIVDYVNKRNLVKMRMIAVPKISQTFQNSHFNNHKNNINIKNNSIFKSFYRMTIGDISDLDEKKNLNKNITMNDKRKVVFSLLNDTTVYTTIKHVPFSWDVVLMKTSGFDLYNIYLAKMGKGVHSVKFSLSDLVVEGRINADSGDYTEKVGISLLDTRKNIKISETFVAETRGYWQLKANPGQYSLSVNPNDNIPNAKYENKSFDFLVSSFSSHLHSLIIKSVPDYIYRSCNSMHTMESNSIKNSNKKDSKILPNMDKDQMKLNFLVFPKDMIELDLKVLIISIFSNLKSKQQHQVKFYFLSESLSSHFKNDILPIMSQKYNFEFQLLSYKWPRWIEEMKPSFLQHHETVSLYKALFIDLFVPLNVDKLICLDSNLVVRNDISDLANIDLEKFGTPYAFTKSCEYSKYSQRDSEHSRFLKSILQNKNLHKADLFVVDLKRFRENGVGDWLRLYYHLLSANLGFFESDLAAFLFNYAQNYIPLFSLPQNWLCCNEDSFSQSKIAHISDFTKRNKEEEEWLRNLIDEANNFD